MEFSMSQLSPSVSAPVEYDQLKRRISLDRMFQIPSMFRPKLSALFGNTVGRLNLERPANGVAAIANWMRFARWRQLHPLVQLDANDPGRDRGWLYQTVIEQEGLERIPVDFWEFGVFRGDSLFWWTERIANPESRFVGFDTFTGLPERWRATEPERAFNMYGRLPEVTDSRCTLEAGLFQDTLLPLASRHDFSRRLVVHLDADLFSSTLFVLTTLGRHFKHGDIIFFDNFICSFDEFRAFEAFVKAFRVKYELLGAIGEYSRVCVKVL
jgi:O-methyltransferase